MSSTSRNPLPPKVKAEVTAILLPLVYSGIDLKNETKLAHWNLRDANFIAVHRLLDEVVSAVDEGTDQIAERIRQLGAPIDATSEKVFSSSGLKDFPKGIVNSKQAIEAITNALAQVIQNLHDGIDKIDEAGDAITADILTQISGKLELQLWFLESHL